MAFSEPSVSAEWTLLADYALVDQAGKLSVIGIFSRLWAPTFPTMHPSAYLVTAWSGPANQSIGVELRVWSPTNELLIGGQQQLQLGSDGQASGIFRLSPLPLPSPGKHIFEVLAGGTSMVHVDLVVEQLAAP